jgi:hypothetical protein
MVVFQSPTEFRQFIEAMIRKLKSAGLSAAPLERVQGTAFASSSEWLGELGLAIRNIKKQKIVDAPILSDLDKVLDEVHKVWPNIERSRPTMAELHPELKHKVWLNRYVGAFSMGLIAAGIFRSVIAATIRGDEDWRLVALRASIGALFAWATVYAWTSAAWYHRLSRLIRDTDAIPVQVRFGWAECALVATITPMTTGQFKGRVILCDPPNWKIEALESTEILGHIDPEPTGPIVLKTKSGIIWPLERARSKEIKS